MPDVSRDARSVHLHDDRPSSRLESIYEGGLADEPDLIPVLIGEPPNDGAADEEPPPAVLIPVGASVLSPSGARWTAHLGVLEGGAR